MKITKVSLAMLILICAIGIVAAAELSDFKVGEGYTTLKEGSYTNGEESIAIDIISENDIDDLNDAFKNDSDVNYTVESGKLNNTFNFTDEANDMTGVSELVKIKDKNYVIEVWDCSVSGNVTLEKLYDTLEEVNKLNNIEPINPATLD
ncbi:hypothetical protein [Methanobrevibacter sp.]|uniref:hypothetical protein n=1 Tax=Methanobrevibacter sp. TaxID=66852 RepID=UPI00386FC34F